MRTSTLPVPERLMQKLSIFIKIYDWFDHFQEARSIIVSKLLRTWMGVKCKKLYPLSIDILSLSSHVEKGPRFLASTVWHWMQSKGNIFSFSGPLLGNSINASSKGFLGPCLISWGKKVFPRQWLKSRLGLDNRVAAMMVFPENLSWKELIGGVTTSA